MKRKIAILTQPLKYNYGGIIQNYALQTVLSNLGHETITINRIEDNPHPKIKVLASRFKNLILRSIIPSKRKSYLSRKKIGSNNQRFIERYIHMSPELDATVTLSKYVKNKKFDAIVVGSDQVWRPKYSPNIYNFYLDFLKKSNIEIKLAYAASFGTEEWEYTADETKLCCALIQQFNAVSVREYSGIQLCNTYLNRNDVVHVLDPTFLLDAEDYNQIINQPKKAMGLFTYVLDASDENQLFINNCAKKLNLKITKNQAKLKPINVQIDRLEDYIIPPLETWLQGFRDADFVITDSFHGTVFSIINKKPFLAIVNQSRGASRFESILEQLGLQDRLVYNENNYDISKLKQEIDYELVHSKLKHLKTTSLNFLKNYF